MNSLKAILFLNELELMVSSIVIVCTSFNSFTYCYLTLIILFNINYLFAHSEIVSSIANSNNFICTQLNGFSSIAI